MTLRLGSGQAPAIRYAVAVVVAYVFFLIATLPASHAYGFFKDRVGSLHLYGIEGTLWSGHAAQADFRQRDLGQLRWELLARKLLLGRLELVLQSKNDTNQINLTISRALTGRVRIRQLDAAVPLAELPGLASFGPVKTQGLLNMDLRDVTVDDGIVTGGSGRMIWRGAGFAAPQPVALGDFEMNFSSDASGVKGVLRDTGGPLQAQGTLLLKPDAGYQFTGALAARDPQLAEGLKFLGTPGPNGAVNVTWSGVYTGKPAAGAKPKP